MTIEANDKTKPTGEQPSPAPGGTPPAAGGAPAPASAPAPEKKPVEKTEPKVTPEAKQPKKLSGEDDDIPEEEELLQLSPRALKSRLARASKQQLKEAFGTDDVDLIKKKLAAGDEYEKKKEEDRKATLSKEEKLREERDTAIKEARETRSLLEVEKTARIVEKQDGRITRIAEQHLKPKHVSKFLPDLAKALLKAADEGDRKLIKNEEAWIESWFKQQVEEEPEFGKDFGKAAEGGEPPKKLPFTNGSSGSRPQPAGNSGSPKTGAPGKPNSMSDKEIRDLGYSWK
jgi:hypothetical protein